ncbi:MAG TPA: hypothetical protein VJV40_07675, partial [Thermodesulfobacteriota bacterium]|nr:hypothetical protein [Thermodesulfobacteriota bacterium]
GLVQNRDRGNNRPDNKSYGNTAPDDYGVIKKNTGRNSGPVAPDFGKRGDYPGAKNTPDYNHQGGPDRNATVTNRQRNPYSGQPLYNDQNQNRGKSNKAVNNDRMKSYQAPAQAPDQQPASRNSYKAYRGPGGDSITPYQKNPGKSNRQTYNRPALQQKNNYNPGYNAQRQQAPKYDYKPSQRQSNASSNKSTGRSYSNTSRSQYTSPTINQGTRSFNPGSVRSFGGNSYAGRGSR